MRARCGADHLLASADGVLHGLSGKVFPVGHGVKPVHAPASRAAFLSDATAVRMRDGRRGRVREASASSVEGGAISPSVAVETEVAGRAAVTSVPAAVTLGSKIGRRHAKLGVVGVGLGVEQLAAHALALFHCGL